jgi:hypothetical protein
MSHAALAHPDSFALPPTAAWSAPLFTVVASNVPAAYLSDDVKQLVSRVRAMAHTIGSPIAAARTLDDLDAAIEAGIENGSLDLAQQLGQMTIPSDLVADARTSSDDFASAMLQGLDAKPALAERLRLGVSYTADVILPTMQRALEQCEVPLQGSPPDPLHFLHDRTLSVAQMRSFYGGASSTVCLLALAEIAGSAKKPPQWIVEAIVERWVDGLYQFLRLLASIPGQTIPESVVPLNDRFDLEEHLHRAAAREDFFRRVAEDPASILPLEPADA